MNKQNESTQTFLSLRGKAVINCDGQSLGHVIDLEFNRDLTSILALILPKDGALFRFGHRENTRIPITEIIRIGEDVIIVRQTAMPKSEP